VQTLRPYQSVGIDKIDACFVDGKRRVLFVLPTGGGKTSVSSSMIRTELAAGGRVLFLAHRQELITQCAERLLEYGVEDMGIMMGNHPMRRAGARVQVGSVQTVVRRAVLDPEPTLIVVDEAHHARAGTYQTILAQYPRARIVGLTATPWRVDGRGLGEDPDHPGKHLAFEEVVVGATPRQLIDLNFLVPCTGFVYDRPDLKRVQKLSTGDFNNSQLGEAMGQATLLGNVVEQYQAHAAGKRAVLFAVNKEHSRKLVERFVAAGVAAEHLDDETDPDERKQILRRLSAGETHLVSNVAILTEGWDCPAAEVCILARPTLSTALCLQQIGRVMRPAEGKAIARIHDHAGNLFRHGLPDEDRDYSLTADAKPRDRSPREGKTEGEGRTLYQCKACSASFYITGDNCPACGALIITKTTEREGRAIPIEELRRRREQLLRDGRHRLYVEFVVALLKRQDLGAGDLSGAFEAKWGVPLRDNIIRDAAATLQKRTGVSLRGGQPSSAVYRSDALPLAAGGRR
jgi:DNA repair protein RadD